MLGALLASAAFALPAAHPAALTPPDCVGRPDGRQRNGRLLIRRRHGLDLATAGGRLVRHVTRPPGHKVDFDASFSPDGRHVVFARGTAGAAGGSFIMTVDVRSGRTRMIHRPAKPADYDEWPVWSPNGRQIAFHRVVDLPNSEQGFQQNIVRMNPDGSGLTEDIQAGTPEFPARMLDWSPNGRCMAFYTLLPTGQEAVVVGDATGARVHDIWAIYPQSSTFPGGTTGFPHHLAFSANGDRLFINDDLDTKRQVIREVHLDGHALPKRIGNKRVEYRPVPSPDGKLLAFADNHGRTYVQPLSGGHPRLLLNRGILEDWLGR